jgi:hypothetical protein
MDEDTARHIFENLFGGGLGGMFGGMGGMGGMGGGGAGGPRVRIFQTGKRPRAAYEGERPWGFCGLRRALEILLRDWHREAADSACGADAVNVASQLHSAQA